jgi:hypothetical protein
MQLLSRVSRSVKAVGSALFVGLTTYGEYHLGSS